MALGDDCSCYTLVVHLAMGMASRMALRVSLARYRHIFVLCDLQHHIDRCTPATFPPHMMARLWASTGPPLKMSLHSTLFMPAVLESFSRCEAKPPEHRSKLRITHSPVDEVG